MDKVEATVYQARGELYQHNPALHDAVAERFEQLFGTEPAYVRYITIHQDNIKNWWHIVEVDGFRIAIPKKYQYDPWAWDLAESKNPLKVFTTARYEDFTLEGIAPWHLKRRQRRLSQHQRAIRRERP